jgi:uncharacterized protein (TIGR03435 family)
MTERFLQRLSVSFIGQICVVVLLVGSFPSAFAQASSAPGSVDSNAGDAILPGATYDIATIRPTEPSEMGSVRSLPSGEFISIGMPMKNTVSNAYGRFGFEILGGPSWFESDKYDIDAKPDSALGERLQKLTWGQREEVQGHMLQALLVDRFKLKVHEDTRQLPIFALVVGKGGPKLQQAKAGEPYRMTVGNGRITAQAVPIDELAATLTGSIDHVVSNRTGLAGVYDFTIHYSDDVAATLDSSTPSIYTALEEQLGLKVEPAKGPVKVLIIDHVERPSEN